MNSTVQFGQNRLPFVMGMALLLTGVVAVTAYTVSTGLFAVAVMLLIIGVLAVPWHLRLSYVFATVFFQSAFIVPFFPGNLSVWMGACLPAWSGVAMAVILRQTPPDLKASILRNRVFFIGLAVYCVNLLITIQLRGFGLNILGADDTMGGKVPFEQLLCSIIPVAFLCAQSTEKEFSFFYRLQLVFTCSYMISEVVMHWAPQAYYLFYLLAPSSDMVSFTLSEFRMFARYQSLKLAAPALLFLLIVSNKTKSFRSFPVVYLGPISVLLIAASLLSGHREALVFSVCILGVYFWGVRFFNFRSVLSLVGIALVSYSGLLLVSGELPLPMQRSISFLPGMEVSSIAAVNATETFALRWELTKFGWSQFPQYLFLGRGFVVLSSPTEIETATILSKHLWSGHYYNGFIGLMIHTGLIGAMSAMAIYAGGILLGIRVIKRVRLVGVDKSVFNRIAILLSSYCIVKPIYFLLINGNSKVALQEFMVPIAMLLLCERFLSRQQNQEKPEAVDLVNE